MAKDALRTFEEIVRNQFTSFGTLPWLLPVPGECYIKKEWESSPFVQLIYFPNCLPVGFRHIVTRVIPWEIADPTDYPHEEVSDEEFVRLRQQFQTAR